MPQPDLQKLLDSYQSNCVPTMVAELGKELGVTADSLRRLGVGFAPIVPTKKGKNFRGQWVFAERDSNANVVGLSLRGRDGFKMMFLGSNHGLVFAVNPDHEQGGGGADPGQWTRTMNAGVLCPICQRPDGCLVNADTPNDPEGDAICIRIKEGAVRPMKFG